MIVTVSIDDYAELPSNVRDLIDTYRETPLVRGGRQSDQITFQISANRWREIQEALRRIEQ